VYFRAVARVDKVLESSNFGNMPPRCVQVFLESAPRKKYFFELSSKNYFIILKIVFLQT